MRMGHYLKCISSSRVEARSYEGQTDMIFVRRQHRSRLPFELFGLFGRRKVFGSPGGSRSDATPDAMSYELDG